MLRASCVLLVAYLTLAYGPAAQSQQPAPRPRKDRHEQQAHPKDTTKTTSQDQRGTSDSPLVVKVLPTPRNQEDLAREASEREEKASSDRKLVLWTAVLAVTTILLASLTALNLVLLWRQGRDLKEQRGVMQRQATHLEEQAIQLKASVGQMKDTAERQLRAYLSRSGTPSCREWLSAETGHYFEFRIPIKNAGLTPASRIQADTHVKIYPLPLPERRVHSFSPEARSALGPSQIMELVARVGPVSPSEHMEVKRGVVRKLFLEGSVVYRDAFGREHNFQFFEGVEWREGGIVTYPEGYLDETE